MASHLVGVLGRPDAEVLRVRVRVRGAHGRVRHLRNVIAERAIQCVGHLRNPSTKPNGNLISKLGPTC